MLPHQGIPIWVKLIAIAFCLLLLLSLAATGVYGFRLGRITSQQQHAQLLQELRVQMDEGFKAGNLALALWAGEQLEAWGQLNPVRQEQIQQLRQRQQQTEEAPDATAPPADSPATSPTTHQHELWLSAQTAFRAGEWAQSIQDLASLRAIDAKFVTVAYLNLLEEAHIGQARALIAADRHEEAMMQLQVALALRQSEHVQDEIEAAYLMTESLSFWGVDWEEVIGALQQVYAYDPAYTGVKARLVRALQLYHDRIVAQGEYCSGYLFLSSREALVAEMGMAFLQAELQQQCRAATS